MLQRILETDRSKVRRDASKAGPPERKQKQVRLSRQQREELVELHRKGAFKKELARTYGIHVETVRAIVRRHSTIQGWTAKDR